MEPSRTPLLDYFRRGEAPADLRLLAAKVVLAPRALEQLELLRLLVKEHGERETGARRPG